MEELTVAGQTQQGEADSYPLGADRFVAEPGTERGASSEEQAYPLGADRFETPLQDLGGT